MPLFEYECRGCGRRFEQLTRAAETPRCPSCGRADLQKLLSAFAVGRAGGDQGFEMPESSACSRCGDPRGPGSCALD